MLSLPHYPPAFWFVAVFGVIILGIDKAGFGGGVGIVATPLIALTIPVPEAAAIMLPIFIVADIFSLRHYYRTFDWPSIRVLLPGAVVGIAVGALLFNFFAEHANILRVGVGLLALLFVLYQVGRSLIVGVLAQTRLPAPLGALLGMFAGIGSTLVHAGGPFVSVYLIPQRLSREIFVGTTVVLFASMNFVKLVPYAYLGLLRVSSITTVLLLAPLAVLSVRLGIWLNRRFDNTWFQRTVYALLFLTGLQLVFG
jgi:uncharacterized membrane protein YfcA